MTTPSSYFVGRLGQADSLLGNIQPGVVRVSYFGALENLTSAETNTHGTAILVLFPQARSFKLQTQAKFQNTISYYGVAVYGIAPYGTNMSMQVQTRPFVLSVQPANQGS